MKKTFKTIVKVILSAGFIAGFALAMAESESATTQIIWSLSWLAEMTICFKVYRRLFPEEFSKEGRA